MKELRFSRATELRIVTQDGKRQLHGYASVFNSPSEDLGGFRETVMPGAFTRTLKSNPDIKLTSEHNAKGGILGRTKSGTLQLEQDSRGLAFRCDLPNTQLGNDTAESVGRGDLDGASFAFVAKDSKWANTSAGVMRSLHDVDLKDVTITSDPAYTGTSVQLRSLLFPEGPPEVPIEFRGTKTLTVDGEHLTSEDFVIVGDANDTSTWKLPWRFSDADKTKSHLRDALARFNQLKGVPMDEKTAAHDKLVKLAKEHGIHVADDTQGRSMNDGDGNDAEDSNDTQSDSKSANANGCECECLQCAGGDCSTCSDMDCNDPNCTANQRSIDKLLAWVCERRTRVV